jgi:CHAT domain-containing protein
VTLNRLGAALRKLGRNEKAIEIFEQALGIAREMRLIPLEGSILNSLGYAYFNLGRLDQALECSEQALVHARNMKYRAKEAATLHQLAQIMQARGDLGRSRANIEECLQIAESLRSEIYNQESRASYFTSAREYHEFFIDLLMRLDQSNPGQGYDALALEASERGRARGLLELLTEAVTDIRQGVDARLLEQERTLARRLNAKAQQLSLRRTPGQSAALNQEISDLENEYQQTQAAIRRSSPRYASLTSPQPLRLSEIQGQLDEETLLLEFTLGEARSFLWAVGKNSLASFELPGREQVEQASRRVYDLMTARSRTLRLETPLLRRDRISKADAQLTEAAGQLSRMLLSPAAAALGSKRLVIVADGALQYLPFSMLSAPQSQGVSPRPLILDHEIINLPSASTLAAQRRELAGRTPAPKTLAVIADPVFAASDERMKTLVRNASTGKGQTHADALTASVENTRIIEHLSEDSPAGPARNLVIPRLPFTRREADQISAIASGSPGSETLKALDFKANREVFSNSQLSRYRYVHFATHGLLDSRRPGLSALVLSLVDEQGRSQDGFLRAHEIYNMSLPAELVVLSACQTGLGKEVKGEGLVGLTRGFMYAGAA